MGLFTLFGSRGININETAAALEEGAVLLDVREKDEYASGHIPGAFNYPVSSLEGCTLPWPKDQKILVYWIHCREAATFRFRSK